MVGQDELHSINQTQHSHNLSLHIKKNLDHVIVRCSISIQLKDSLAFDLSVCAILKRGSFIFVLISTKLI